MPQVSILLDLIPSGNETKILNRVNDELRIDEKPKNYDLENCKTPIVLKFLEYFPHLSEIQAKIYSS